MRKYLLRLPIPEINFCARLFVAAGNLYLIIYKGV